MKKFASILLAALLVFALTIPAFADPPYTITIDNANEGHTYEAYQVFTGDLDEAGVLSSVKWGTGVNVTALIPALQADTAFVVGEANIFAGIAAAATDATAVAVATALNGINNDADMAKALAKVIGNNLATTNVTSTVAGATYTIAGLASGYYFVKDADESMDGDNDAATRYVLEVVKDVTVTPKSSIPTVEKKVLEESYAGSDSYYGEHYNDVADYDIGDAVPFELIGTMPTTLGDYATYDYTFTDTLSAGLTYDAASIQVFVDNAGVKTEVNTADYTVTAPTLVGGAIGGGSFTVDFDDVKALTDTTETPVAIAVTSASKIFVYYTATLNANAVIGLDGNPNEVYLEYSNNPNGTGKGKTPTDYVIVFTYELDVTKIEAETPATKLAGAEFQLYKTVGTDKFYAKVTDGKLTGWSETEAGATTLTSDENGLFVVSGLDDGTYYLHESKAPTGYNILLEDVTLVIDATTVNNQTWSGTSLPADALTALKIAVNGGEPVASTDTNKGIVQMNVENAKGSLLPSTGGIGTTIFTVLGIAVMLGAAVLLIVRRRMQAVNG